MWQYLALLAVWCQLIFNHRALPFWTRIDCECGRPYYDDEIYGGQEVRPNEYPWIAFVLLRKGIDFDRCGGSIINGYYILTAAHCVNNTMASNVTVYIGLHGLKTYDPMEVSTHDVSKIIIHPDYTRYSQIEDNRRVWRSVYDVALLKLHKGITFSKSVSPICLPNKGEDFTDSTAIVAGWGYIKELNMRAQDLRHVELKVLSKQQCLSNFSGDLYKVLANQILCTHKPDGDACEGDSGGPLMFRTDENIMVLIGVISFGPRCRPTAKDILYRVGYYAKVTYFLDWIYRETSDELYCLNTRNYN